jgi:hypothetical protein
MNLPHYYLSPKSIIILFDVSVFVNSVTRVQLIHICMLILNVHMGVGEVGNVYNHFLFFISSLA